MVFQNLDNFSIGDFGSFWALIRDDFPTCDSKPLIDPTIESFDGYTPGELQFRIVPHDVLPRCFYRAADGGELIQIQSDRFTFNWSSAGGGRYPNFDMTLARFLKLFEQFSQFIAGQDLGFILIRQCEITNVNIVPVSDLGSSISNVGKAFRLPEIALPDDLIQFESITIQTQSRIIDREGRPIGRLHSVIVPVKKIDDDELAIKYELTARGAPTAPDINGVVEFFTVARSAINASFLATTTDWAQSHWGYSHA